MIPKPKSEAWFLCAVKENPYQHCDSLENASGNDSAPYPLKEQLKNALGEEPAAELLSQMIRDQRIEMNRINMPSLDAFKQRLEDVFEQLP